MGRLAGFSYQEVIRKMRRLGFEFYRSAKGDYEIWLNPITGARATIPHHRTLREGTLRNVPKQAGIEVDEFLDS